MKRYHRIGIVAGWLAAGAAFAQSGRIYTAIDSRAAGGITGALPAGELTHALAVDQDRVRVFRGSLPAGNHGFRFEHLPVGKYDLVLVTKARDVWEGLRLGAPTTALSTAQQSNLEKRIRLADTFFNRCQIHRCGVEGERVLVLVERLRDRLILQQSGETLNANLRRLEIIELTQAADDWQMIQSRHLYREGEPLEKAPPFLRHAYLPALGGIRVVEQVTDLGVIPVPKN